MNYRKKYPWKIANYWSFLFFLISSIVLFLAFVSEILNLKSLNMKLFQCLSLLILCLLTWCKIQENDNLIRNKRAYQSSTLSQQYAAATGNDDMIDYGGWTKTDSDSDWWAVDMGNQYRVQEICFLNRYNIG